MELKVVIEAIKLALVNMNQDYSKLSKKDYKNIETTNSFIENLKKVKYLERPIAYEFYHQLRRLMDEGDVNFGGPIIQAEVDKRYQHLFKKGNMPDFIIHTPDSKSNLVIIEFKLATRAKEDIKDDFVKIVKFKTNSDLNYSYGVEVLLGDKHSLEIRRKDLNEWNKTGGEEIIIIEFDTGSWKADHSVLQFKE
ncbi:hypothetical protein LCGC14_2798400 [marine sediment metagenome]|uniref:Uncharacterized protein n=1 Tax=marine sediment metagenome TaxID=412755 RepID=A0A0F8YNF8_9ZZZZ